MAGVPRRTIVDLVAMYTYEPTLADIYVEGSTDKALLEYVINDTDVHVIDIDLIDLPAPTLAEFGLTPGRRESLIALGISLERALDNSGYRIKCLIDADLDRFLGRQPPSSTYVTMTDFCCLESYWFSTDSLLKYRKLGLHDKGPLGAVDLCAVIEPVIRKCFLLRAAAASLDLSLAWLDPTSVCERVTGGIEFDEAEFVDRWLNKNSALEAKSALVGERDRLRAGLGEDTRDFMHGKDFINILAWYVRPYVGVTFLAHIEVVARMLACCVDRQALVLYPVLAEFVKLGGKGSISS